MSENIEFTILNKDGSESKAWLNLDEFNFLKAFRHYRTTMLHKLGFNNMNNVNIINEFNLWYAINFPDNAKFLKLGKNE